VWTEEDGAKWKTLVQRFTSRSASGACRVHRLWLVFFWLVWGDTEDRNHISGQWYNEWPLDAWVDSLIFGWLKETFLTIIINNPAEYPEPDPDNTSRGVFLPEQERHNNALRSTPFPQKVVLLCPLLAQVQYLMRRLNNYFVDHVDIFHLHAEMGNDEHTEMQLTFQDSQNPSVFITSPNVGWTGLNLTAENHAVISQKFWVLNELQQAFAQVVHLEQNRVPVT